MLMILVTVPGKPLNAGTVARFRAAAMQAPLEVPANGGSLTVALDTLPLASNVTTTVALPAGPPFSRHCGVCAAAVARAAFAALASKRCVGPVTPCLSSAVRAPLANNSAKPALGVATGPLPGGSIGSPERALSSDGAPVSAGAGSAARGVLGVVGAASGNALIGAGGGRASPDERVSTKINAPTATTATPPMISGMRLFFGHSGTSV